MRDQHSGAERADQPARAHRDAEQREGVDQLLGTDDVVGVALAGGPLDAADDPGDQGQQQEVREAHAPRERQRAERRGRERLAGARQHQQAMAWKSIGEDAGRSADEEERERTHSERHAD